MVVGVGLGVTGFIASVSNTTVGHLYVEHFADGGCDIYYVRRLAGFSMLYIPTK